MVTSTPPRKPPAVLVLLLALGLPGCGTVIGSTYGAATEERSLAAQVDDTAIVAKINKGYLDASRENLLLTVFCHQGLVVLAGVVEDPKVRERAVAVARGVEGVRRVETFFVPRQPSAVGDFAISTKVKAKIVADRDLRLWQFDLTTLAGNVVLTGLVDRQEKIDQVVRYARSVEGVVGVKSFMQIKAP